MSIIRSRTLGSFVLALLSIQFVWGQGSKEEYELWKNYGRRTSGKVFRDRVRPNWIGQDLDRFWYQVRTGPKTHEYVLVDGKAAERKAAFDHELLAGELSKQSGQKVDPERLELRALSFESDGQNCRFRFAGKSYRFRLPVGPLVDADDIQQSNANPGIQPQKTVVRSVGGGERVALKFQNDTNQRLEIFWMPESGRPVSYGHVDANTTFEMSSFPGHAFVLRTSNGKPRACFVASLESDLAIIDQSTPIPTSMRDNRGRRRPASGNGSPDKKYRVEIKNHNVTLLTNENNESVFTTTDGGWDNSYGGRVWWSPNSKYFVVLKTRPGQRREISMIESAPGGSIHSRVHTMGYAKPGDRLDHSRPVLFSVEDKKPNLVDDSLFPNPFRISDFGWDAEGSEFRFLYNQRGHQVLRLVGIAGDTGKPRTIAEETPGSFVCYSSKSFMRYVGDDQLVWMSERSGWNHLYLVDVPSGKIKNAITSGDWVVRSVERIDEDRRRAWLVVSGIDGDQDPYHRHLIRVDLDRQNLVRLTEGDGDHSWEFSPDGRYLIDRYSRVDLPPVHELRDAETGKLLCQLEAADASRLLEMPWLPPQRFVAKGRDGQTDIHGIIIRPTHFNPDRKYPVLEAIYAGPHSAFVPKQFGTHGYMAEMAELGFIIVKIDGMGTNHRSKAFHDVCWKNLGDSGFPDRVLWMKAAAKEHPELDLSRVGIWGGSAGGQSAMRALISHGDFYKAASADCGCHDNRVDKIWWNEQWMGYPVGPHYAEQSNVTQAHRVKGDLMLIWGELDRNVDPASTMQVIDALIKADVDFEQLIVPGAGHGAAGGA